MKVKLVKIGNSMGVRLPKTVIEECHLLPELELIPKNNSITLQSIKVPRDGWKDAIKDDISKHPMSSLGEWEW